MHVFALQPQETIADPEPPPVPEPEAVLKVKDDPRYAKYFKMMNMVSMTCKIIPMHSHDSRNFFKVYHQ